MTMTSSIELELVGEGSDIQSVGRAGEHSETGCVSRPISGALGGDKRCLGSSRVVWAVLSEVPSRGLSGGGCC